MPATSADPCEAATKSPLRCGALRPSRPRAHSHRKLKKGPTRRLQPPARGSTSRGRPRAAGETPCGPAPPRSDALTSTAFPTGPASAAIGGSRPHLHSQPRLFLPWPRSGAEPRRDGRKAAQHRSPRGPRLPHPPLPAVAAAPSGVAAAAPGVAASREQGEGRGGEGTGGAARRARPASGAWPRRPGPGKETQAGPHQPTCQWSRDRAPAEHFQALGTFPSYTCSPLFYCHTTTIDRSWRDACMTESALPVDAEEPQVTDLVQRNIRQLNSTLFSLLSSFFSQLLRT